MQINSIDIDYRVAIRTHFNSLGGKKRRIAEFVLENPMQVVSGSIQELAKFCECEQTTIVRFAQQLGFSGFTDLKIAIAKQANIIWSEFGNKSGSFSVLERLSQLHCESISETLRKLDSEVLERLFIAFEAAPMIMTAGAGASQLAAMDMAAKLMRLGVHCINYSDAEWTKVFLGYLDKKGLLIIFSNSGETEAMLELAEIAHQKQIALASISSYPGSRIAVLADYSLTTLCRHERPIRFGVMTSRIAQFAVVDAIALLFSMRNQERSWDFIVKGVQENV